MTSPCAWRIDDLAQRAGVTVDTVRYYQREALLPDGERAGRVKFYGPVHLERLDRIRDLQRRGFSLAAIRTLLDRDPSLVEAIFADRGEARTYRLDELVERSGIDRGLCAALRASGLLRDPAEYGRDAYDDDDLDVLRTMAQLHGMGIPTKALVELGRIYAHGIAATQHEVVGLFSTGGTLDWGPGELEQFQAVAGQTATEILPLARQLVDYVHHRTIQRLVFHAIERGTLQPPDG